MSTAKENIEQRLTEILKRKNAVCIVLDGEWGVGKTTFWKNFSAENFDKNSVYVSLFGKESIQEIKQEIGIQIYKRNKYISEFSKKARHLKFDKVIDEITPKLGSAVIGCISFFEKKDFKDIIICFDDFERMSDKINLKDVLGLISEYKEQQNCHIVMILNRSKMTALANEVPKEDEENLKDKELKNDSQVKDNKIELEKILSQYKDKIMDYEFYYDPTPQESFNIVSGELAEVYRDSASQYFAKHDINNIRVMRRAINALNDYKQHLEDKLQKYQPIKDNVITYILGISIINAMNSSAKLERFLGVLNFFGELEDVYDLFKNKKDMSKKEYAEYSLIISYDAHYRQLGANILSYAQKSIIDTKSLDTIIENIIKNEQYQEIKKEILNEYFKGTLDLQYDNRLFVKSLFSCLETNKENIIDIVGVSPFILYIETLGKFDEENEQKYHKFATKVLLDYIRGVFENNQYQNLYTDILDEMINFDDRVKELHDNFITQNEIYKISSAERIIENIFNTRVPIQKELTSKITEEILEKYCYENLEFLRSAIGFLQRDISRLPDNKELKDKILKVFKKISKNGDENQKLKMKFILEDLKEKAHLE
nr:P-loop NTPase fold protein [uncultured Campylobacter sp.]